MEDGSMMSGTPSASMDSSEGKSSFVTPDAAGSKNYGEAIKTPHDNDVLCGRGGSINSHPGNERFRDLVEKRKRVYLTARFKREKRMIASSIVSEIRGQQPPGRFLQRDAKTGLWRDIGDEKARDKTSQALRENAPSIRAEIETEINEQRAKNEREEAANAAHYYSGWGFPGYYGWGAQPPPPPSGYHPGPYDSHAYYHGHGYPPPPTADPYAHPPPHPPAAAAPKSALEQTADFVSSGAESLKNWIGGSVHSVNSSDQRSYAGGSMNSKPLSYRHEDESKKRRMVKFSDDSYERKRRPCYSPVQSSTDHNSLMDGMHDIEPENLDAAQNSSLMAHVANQILGSIGSWDAATVICGGDSTYDDKPPPFPKTSGGSAKTTGETLIEEDMAVEWEGQEVQLVDDARSDAGERMPPPPPKNHHHEHNSIGVASMGNNSIAFSSLGSCHSWLPESFGNSYFPASVRSSDGHQSMEMEYSHSQSNAGTENFSVAGSIGGGSLTRVFEQDEGAPPAPDDAMSSPNMSRHELSQMPSWERSLRSKSPLSDDDESLMSKGSSKVSEGALSPRNAASPSNFPSETAATGDMPWTRE